MRYVKRIAFWGVVLLLAAAAYGLQQAADSMEGASSATLKWEPPNSQTIKLASFGFEQLVSDYYWVKSLLYVMEQFDREERDYSPLAKVYEIITDLDSRFGLAYHYGSVYVTWLAKEPEKSIALLKKGLRLNDKDWRFRWLLNYDIGSTYSVRLGQREKATSYYKAAALDPNCPPGWTKHIQKVLSASAVEPHREAFELWKRRLETAQGPIMKQIAEQEMMRAQSGFYLDELRDAATEFEEKSGKRPRELEELIKSGIVEEIPNDPLGGMYSVNVEGKVVRLDTR